MQGVFGRGGDLAVTRRLRVLALAAGILRIGYGGKCIHTLVRGCFVHAGRVAAMAGSAGDLTMGGGKKLPGNKHLYVRLQLSHGAASAGP